MVSLVQRLRHQGRSTMLKQIILVLLMPLLLINLNCTSKAAFKEDNVEVAEGEIDSDEGETEEADMGETQTEESVDGTNEGMSITTIQGADDDFNDSDASFPETATGTGYEDDYDPDPGITSDEQETDYSEPIEEYREPVVKKPRRKKTAKARAKKKAKKKTYKPAPPPPEPVFEMPDAEPEEPVTEAFTPPPIEDTTPTFDPLPPPPEEGLTAEVDPVIPPPVEDESMMANEIPSAEQIDQFADSDIPPPPMDDYPAQDIAANDIPPPPPPESPDISPTVMNTDESEEDGDSSLNIFLAIGTLLIIAGGAVMIVVRKRRLNKGIHFE